MVGEEREHIRLRLAEHRNPLRKSKAWHVECRGYENLGKTKRGYICYAHYSRFIAS